MQKKQPEQTPRPRLKKETLRGLGFAELDQVHGGDSPWNGDGNTNNHGRKTKSPNESRYCE